jgi:hypothetical protein
MRDLGAPRELHVPFENPSHQVRTECVEGTLVGNIEFRLGS